MKNTGKEAERAFLNRVNAVPKTVVERFYDQADLRGINGGRPVGDFPKPSDFLVTQSGILFYAEVKSTQSKTCFSFGDIRPGQRSAALKQAMAGGPYYFFIFTYGLGQWFCLPCQQFAKAVQDGKKSIKFKDLTEWLK
jgi:hypothetical protein